jgi:hypothetical protein
MPSDSNGLWLTVTGDTRRIFREVFVRRRHPEAEQS